MADYTVSGAGTSACNGDYTANGTHNGEPKYEHSSGNYWIFYEFFDMEARSGWVIDTAVSDLMMGGDAIYVTADDNITGTWYKGMGGSDPAPTVAAASGSSTHVIAGTGTGAGTATATMNATWALAGAGTADGVATLRLASDAIVPAIMRHYRNLRCG